MKSACQTPRLKARTHLRRASTMACFDPHSPSKSSQHWFARTLEGEQTRDPDAWINQAKCGFTVDTRGCTWMHVDTPHGNRAAIPRSCALLNGAGECIFFWCGELIFARKRGHFFLLFFSRVSAKKKLFGVFFGVFWCFCAFWGVILCFLFFVFVFRAQRDFCF